MGSYRTTTIEFVPLHGRNPRAGIISLTFILLQLYLYSGDLQGYTHLIYNSPHRLLLLISLLSYPLHDLLASSTVLQSIAIPPNKPTNYPRRVTPQMRNMVHPRRLPSPHHENLSHDSRAQEHARGNGDGDGGEGDRDAVADIVSPSAHAKDKIGGGRRYDFMRGQREGGANEMRQLKGFTYRSSAMHQSDRMPSMAPEAPMHEVFRFRVSV